MESQKDDCVLSDDNIFEILTKVDLLSLPSCLSVCKSWRRVGNLLCFGEAHSLRTTKTFGFILQKFYCDEYKYAFVSMHSLYAHPLPISYLPPGSAQTFNIESIDLTHNLLFCNIKSEYNSKNNINPRYYITRLGTTLYNIPIPSPETSFDTYGIAFFCEADNIKQSSFDFKIVRISQPQWGPTQAPLVSYCEILDCKAKKWRRSKDLPSLWLEGKTGIVIKEKAYWINGGFQNPRVGFSSCSVFAFNVEKEKGKIIKGPEVAFINSNQSYKWRIVPYEERLCLVCITDENINVWMMLVGTSDENIHQWEWKGSYSTYYIKNYKFTFANDTPNQKVVLLETLHRELWYDLHRSDLVTYSCAFSSVFRICMDGNF